MLDLGLVMQILVLGRLDERRIEDLFLDRRVHRQRIADLGRELELALIVVACLLELLEPLLHLAVIRLQQRDRVLACTAAPRVLRVLSLFALGHDAYSSWSGEHARRLRPPSIATDHGNVCKVLPTSIAIASHL